MRARATTCSRSPIPRWTKRDATAAARPKRGTDVPFTLDASGGGRVAVKNLERSDRPRDLVAELEYRDPNGETMTSATRVALWPSRVVLGIKPDSWVSSKDVLKFTVVALDVDRQACAERARADGRVQA